jgi:hypothetical protein
MNHVIPRASALALLLAARLLAAQSGRALAIEDYYRVKTVGAPALSPDARWVAFTVSTRIEETNGMQSEVWLVPADASSPAQRVSTLGVNATAPDWTLDGRLKFNTGGRTLSVDPRSPDRPDTAISHPGVPVGRGGRASQSRLTSPNGQWVATLRDFAPPTRDTPALTDFEKRNEAHFEGVQFDYMDFHRDGAASFPIPNRRDVQLNPPQEVVISPASGGAERKLTALGLRPVDPQWNRDGTILLLARSGVSRRALITSTWAQASRRIRSPFSQRASSPRTW